MAKMPDGWVILTEEKKTGVTLGKPRELVLCRNCRYFCEDIWSVIHGMPVITCHNICDFWGGRGCATDPDGYCYKGEKKNA